MENGMNKCLSKGHIVSFVNAPLITVKLRNNIHLYIAHSNKMKLCTLGCW